MKFKRIDQVDQWRLCIGCGACVPACPNHAITLVDITDRGIRPVVNSEICESCGDCVQVCPGIEIIHRPFNDAIIPELSQEWGPVIEMWEGYATDSEIRYCGSSGGLATALALFGLEKKGISGVLQIGTKSEAPLRNVAVFSKSRADLLACTGSRYSPAAPCEKFDWIKEAPGSSIFVGKPCDIVALRKSQSANPKLNEKVSLAVSIFCAQTPTTKGTYTILDELGVEPENVEELRYRGCGWPGVTSIKTKGNDQQMYKMKYEEAWGNILSNAGQFRCRLCPDSTGEFADISCGDPWYREVKPDEKGWSLVLVRTEKGREFLQEAIRDGYVKLERVGPDILPRSQKALLTRRRHLWGRLLTMRMMCIPVPHYVGFSLFRSWLGLPVMEKLRSLAGTIKRIVSRRWTKPIKVVHCERQFTLSPGEGKNPKNIEEVKPQCRI
jgi:coenzyme F420 hydrogenase subunit beta